jgi:ferritin-like metal-binding protein YciE
MQVSTPKELFVTLLSQLRQGAERSTIIYDELGEAAEDREIKEALDAREFISTQILSRLDECFRLLGEKPIKLSGRLEDVFVDEFRKQLNEIQSPAVRRLYILARASRLMHLWMGEYVALIAVADTLGHPAIGVLLESCLADKVAFAQRARRLIREQLASKLAA